MTTTTTMAPRSAVIALAMFGSACVITLAPIGDDDDVGDDTMTGDGDTDNRQLLVLTTNQDVDILLVIDNSSSMGEEQARLAGDVASFIEVLEEEQVGANYRIGMTTTDNGNPWCPVGTTTPEGGKLVLSSCKNRLGDFLFSDGVDVQDLACNDICNLSDAELQVIPTATDVDPNAVPRPWLENIQGKTNLPVGTNMAEAAKCFVPQGVNGCAFESQLESMYLALARAADNNETNYGFMRESAILAIVIVTDEADCSYNKDWADIFDADGNKVFWSDPTATIPTSAVCWNAGVECTGDPSGYDSCDAVNKDVDGNVGVDDAHAALHPVTRYLDRVQGIEDAKKQLDPDREVIVSLIAGAALDGSVVYADASDPAFQDSFGIGPGCISPEGDGAVPPVRMRDFADAFTPASTYSICSSDYTPAFQAIADSIRTQIEPACYTQCVRDTNPVTAILDPDCTVDQKLPGLAEPETLEECERNLDGSYTIDPVTNGYSLPADDVDVCYAVLVDHDDLSVDPNDDMSLECTDLHYNVQFVLARRAGVPVPSGTAVSAECSLSDSPAVDCPNLGVPG